MNNGDKPLPCSEDGEKGLICSLLHAPGPVSRLCANRLRLEAFSIPAHRIIYSTILEWDKPGGQVDFVWLRNALKDQIEEVGGPEYLDSLYVFVPTAANAPYYLDIVLETYCRRCGVLLGRKLSELCSDPTTELKDQLAEVEREFSEIVHSNNGVTGTRPFIEFLKPSQIKAYEPPAGTLLVGDNHIVRGSVFVVAGAPGVGKSRSTIALAEAGATKLDWLGLKVHSNFRTMIVQNENGRYRLKLEFSELDAEVLDQYLVVSPPPPYGLRFDKRDFRDQLKAGIDRFQPAVIWIDPWNAVARDDKQRDYRETFDLVRDVIPSGDDAPAIGICAHTRKPLPNERTNGRALLNLLAGSHVLASVPRAVWVMQHASDDVSENRVVVTCCKNNDGELGPRSVWLRDNGLWTPQQDFDWSAWDHGEKEQDFTCENVAEILVRNSKGLSQAQLASEIKKRGVSQATAYRRIEKAEKPARSASRKERTCMCFRDFLKFFSRFSHEKKLRGFSPFSLLTIP